VWLAASISITSTKLSVFIALQILQLLQGFHFSRFSQLTAFAKILAVLVFPVHLGQHKRYAPTVLFSATAFCKVFFTNSCPTKDLKS